MAGESYTTKKILLKAVDGTTTQYFIPYVNNATADKTGLVKPDGTTITIDANGTISAHVDISGLQPKIDADHKLSADLISDGTTNKVVTATEKSTWNGKQDVISDLSTIRANATAGAEAASTIAGYGDIVTHDADEFLTEHQDISGKQDKITSTNKLSADLISEGTTNKLVSASEKSAWNNKQDAISDLSTIRSNATAGANAATTIAGYGDVVTHDADEFAEATHTHTKSQITDFPTIPTVNDAEIEIQKNGTKVASFTTNQGGSKKTINITVPTSAADVSALPASTKYGSTIDLAVDPDTYVVTATLKDQDGTTLSSGTVDLPLESVVVSGSYDSTNKKVILTLQSGSTIEFSVADLVSGLQTEITSTNKLSADLIKDGTTNKTVTATEKSTWNGKQDAISDLSTIRTNATAGAGAASTIAGYGDIVTHDADEFAEASHSHAISDVTNLQTTLNGKQATIDSSHKLSADLISDGTTNKTVTATEKSTWSGKQDAISDLSTIRTNAANGAAAATTIAGYGDIVTHDADEFLTEHQDISGKQDKINDLATIRSGAAAGATAVQPDDLATVATSGSYNDLADKPTIPSVGNAEIEIQKNGTKVDSFTTNQSGSKKTINITVPTNNNQLTNGAGYITSAALPTKLSDLTDDLGTSPVHTHGQYLTEHQDISGKANIADLADVATTGSYNDLVDKPTIPSAVTVDSALSSTSTNPVQNKVINTALSGKQATISDLSTIRSNATAGAGAATTIAGYGDIVTHNADEFLTEHQDISGKANTADLATVATSGSYTDLSDKPTIPTVNNKTITINKNGTKVDSFTLNQTSNKAINITVPTTAADVSALPDSTKYAASLSLSVDPDTYVITGQLKDQDGNNLGTAGTIDLPLESVVVSGSYNSSTKKVVLTLKDGSTIEFSIADLVSGLQTEITSTNKLSADLISDGTTNKTVTATEKSTWNAKQAAISDLSTIRTNASNGASAYTTIAGYGDIVTHDADEFASADHTHSEYLTSVAWGDITGKPSTFTPASHNQASNTINALTGYSKSVSGGTGALGTSDTLNKALAKLENALDGKQASGSYAPETHTHTKSQITDFPTIPTITDTYSSTSSNGMSGKAVASAISGITPASIGAATSDHTHSNYVPTSRTINSKALSANITLSASDVGAAASDHTHSNYVPTSRTINSKALTDNISLTASDVGALPDSTAIPSKTSDLTNDSGFVTTDTKNTAGTTNKTDTKMFLAAATSQGANPQTYSNSGCYIGTDNCLYSNGTKVLTSHQSLSGYVPTSRTINSKALSANITLTASDVGALPDTTSIPTKVSDLTNDAGYTTNVGTITGITMNGASKGTSGVVDLGTVITSQYVHPTTSGNKHIPSGGSSGQILKWSADGTATWAAEYSYTHPTTAGNKHVPSGGSSNQVLVYGGSSGTASWGSVPSHNQASSTINAMTSYAKASSVAAIATSDSLNTAVGKLEYKIDDVDTQLQALTAMLNAAS